MEKLQGLVAICEGYGLSETSPVASFNRPDRPRKVGSIGMPVEGVEMAARAGSDLETQLRVIADHIPVGRVGDPREFAALAAFLASERAAQIRETG